MNTNRVVWSTLPSVANVLPAKEFRVPENIV